jgi:hypothetical protein
MSKFYPFHFSSSLRPLLQWRYNGRRRSKMSDMGFLEEFSSLFDLSTVALDEKTERMRQRPSSSSSTIKTEIISYPRVVLTPSTDSVSVVDDYLFAYYEEEEDERSKGRPKSSPLRLNLSRGCGRDRRDTDHFVVPSLRLNYIDNNEYMEPTRDRNKCWALDSQRDILNGERDHEEKFRLVSASVCDRHCDTPHRNLVNTRL